MFSKIRELAIQILALAIISCGTRQSITVAVPANSTMPFVNNLEDFIVTANSIKLGCDLHTVTSKFHAPCSVDQLMPKVGEQAGTIVTYFLDREHSNSVDFCFDKTNSLTFIFSDDRTITNSLPQERRKVRQSLTNDGFCRLQSTDDGD
jgi:hypothetical protein